MASAPGRLGQQFLAVLDVALRVPSIFIIDAILNSHSDPGTGWTGTAGRALIRALGILVSSVVLVLSQKSLLRLYSVLVSLLLGVCSVLLSYSCSLWPRGPGLWLALALLQLLLALGHVALLGVVWPWAAVVPLAVLLPLLGPPGSGLWLASGGLLGAQAALALLLRLRPLYYSCRYVHLLLRHMYRIYGPQLLLEDTWRRVRVPDVLRVFWLTRVAAQAVVLLYVVRAVRAESGLPLGWDVLGELLGSLVISGCDSTLTVLGMSAVISSLAHLLGLAVLAFIGSTEEEDKRLGFVAPVLFFILALQTGLSGLDPEERLVRLSRNMCLLLTAILHFIHGMTDPVLMSLSASQVSSARRHVPVLLVSLALLVLPVLLSVLLWHQFALNTWLFAVTAFCVELCLKVLVSLTVYALFMADGFSGVLWERLDDYVYYVRSTGNIIEFVFGVIMFGNGAYTMMFESGSKIRACMMCLHAYFNIYLQAKSGWRTFINRRTAVKKINSLPEVRGARLRDVEDVCAICYQEFNTSARLTPCHHYFHALCLRKWLYIQDTCPMCHQRVYIEDEAAERAAFSNNNGYAAPAAEGAGPEDVGGVAEAAGGAEPENELLEDNDSIEYDEDEWGTQGPGAALLEDDYINNDSDSDSD